MSVSVIVLLLFLVSGVYWAVTSFKLTNLGDQSVSEQWREREGGREGVSAPPPVRSEELSTVCSPQVSQPSSTYSVS